MRRLIAAAVLLCVATLCASTAAAENEETGKDCSRWVIKGFHLGMSLADVEVLTTLNPDTDCLPWLNCYRSRHPAARFAFDSNELLLRFDRFLDVDGLSNADLIEALLEKWGEPSIRVGGQTLYWDDPACDLTASFNGVLPPRKVAMYSVRWLQLSAELKEQQKNDEARKKEEIVRNAKQRARQAVESTPDPPPVDEGPVRAGFGGVTYPVLISSTKVLPNYPELARKAKVEGNVILEALIRRDGTVGGVKVLRSPGDDLGFEEAAIYAVSQWLYKPAKQNGQPVDVYFTIVVEFVLKSRR